MEYVLAKGTRTLISNSLVLADFQCDEGLGFTF